MEKEPVAPTMGIIILWSRMATLVFDFIAQPTESKIHEISKGPFIYYISTNLVGTRTYVPIRSDTPA